MTLPILAIENDFHAAFKQQPLVVSASTGSGKSTCLPQWAAKYGRVLVVQPRRIACTSLAEYLAEQSGQPLGKKVGYAIRFESHFDDNTEIVFVTPGVALRWFFESKLSEFDAIMLDEFHERRWDTDLLLAILKAHKQHHLIVTSATLDTQPLCHYLGAKEIKSEGNMFPVAEQFIASDTRSMPSKHDLATRVFEAVELAMQNTRGDILVFLPGKGEIQTTASVLKSLNVLVIGLFSGCSQGQQKLALQQQSQQRVILATNVAETSLTIPNITCVIDSGLERRTHLRQGKTVLALEAIAKDSAKQRKGRAGRTQAGICIKLYGEFAPLIERTPSEVTREALTELVLASACAGFPVNTLDFLEPLPQSSLQIATEQLLAVKAINKSFHATELGEILYPLPIDAELAFLITQMPSNALKQAMIDIASIISVPARVYQLPSKSDELEALNKCLPNHCDFELAIAVIRGQANSLYVDENALSEAKQFSGQLREAFSLPELDKAASYDREALLHAIAKAKPNSIFIKRHNRRGAFGNGLLEVIPAKESRVKESAQAMLVLDTYALAGKGTKQSMTLATMSAPIKTSLIKDLELGDLISTEPVLIDEQIFVTQKREYAGVTIDEYNTLASGESLLKACSELTLNDYLFLPVGQQIKTEMAYHALYNLHEKIDQVLPEPNEYIYQTLKDLGVESQDDLTLIEAEDLFYSGVEDWLITPFKEKYPLVVKLPELTLKVEYKFLAKRITVHYDSGSRKEAPKRWELPSWQGFKIQYRKASKVVDVR